MVGRRLLPNRHGSGAIQGLTGGALLGRWGQYDVAQGEVWDRVLDGQGESLKMMQLRVTLDRDRG